MTLLIKLNETLSVDILQTGQTPTTTAAPKPPAVPCPDVICGPEGFIPEGCEKMTFFEMNGAHCEGCEINGCNRNYVQPPCPRVMCESPPIPTGCERPTYFRNKRYICKGCAENGCTTTTKPTPTSTKMSTTGVTNTGVTVGITPRSINWSPTTRWNRFGLGRRVSTRMVPTLRHSVPWQMPRVIRRWQRTPSRVSVSPQRMFRANNHVFNRRGNIRNSLMSRLSNQRVSRDRNARIRGTRRRSSRTQQRAMMRSQNRLFGRRHFPQSRNLHQVWTNVIV